MSVDKSELEHGSQRAFVIMPFDESFDDVYDLIKKVVDSLETGLKVIRLDEIRVPGKISDDLVRELSESTMCIADVSGANPNVMWEVGFATALRKPIIAINDKSAPMPFDIRDVRTVMYNRASLTKTLQEQLRSTIKETLDAYTVASTSLPTIDKTGRLTIAVTGTMECPPEKAKARIRRGIGPYLGLKSSWYVGSFGVVDEVTVSLLLEAGEESIRVVGYGAHDISGRMRDLVRSSKSVEFVDASDEQMPISPGAPSHRDVLFAARCDTVLIGWDGISQGTRQLINWFAKAKKDHQILFVPPLYHEAVGPLIR
jgi:hypothetical protein